MRIRLGFLCFLVASYCKVLLKGRQKIWSKTRKKEDPKCCPAQCQGLEYPEEGQPWVSRKKTLHWADRNCRLKAGTTSPSSHSWPSLHFPRGPLESGLHVRMKKICSPTESWIVRDMLAIETFLYLVSFNYKNFITSISFCVISTKHAPALETCVPSIPSA